MVKRSMTKHDKTHFATDISWFRYPVCGEEGAIFLDSTIIPEKVTCEACRASPEYNKAFIKSVLRKEKENAE